ncbi:WbqC family protein [uncultured Croceitalea sp.]|uniref:WbqC family protein n=1 Tax=uncultured Croceitalea sp. TaxID=1798908 RepID=UPI00374EE669
MDGLFSISLEKEKNLKKHNYLKAVIHPVYFPNVITMAAVATNDVIWEIHDNYQKQTFRNRCHICTDQGKHMLTIPIQHVGGNQGRQKYKDVKLDNSSNWQRQHWRTLQTAYRTSPFFEFYEDDIVPIFENPNTFLLDLNFKTLEFLCSSLSFKLPEHKTSSYEVKPESFLDLRYLVNAKKEQNLEQEVYNQVFGERHGFIENTSTLDLLFNEGPNSLSYLKQIVI